MTSPAMTATTARERMELAKTASRSVGLLSDGAKAEALRAIATAIEEAAGDIVAANAEDLRRGDESGLSTGLRDRLRLDDAALRRARFFIVVKKRSGQPAGCVRRITSLRDESCMG